MAVFFFAGLAIASPSTQEKPISPAVLIGYVDFSRALNEVADGQQARRQLKDEFREKQSQLNKLQEELKRLKGTAERGKLSAGSVESGREEEYRQKFIQMQQRLAAFRSAMAARESHITEDILKRLRAIVADIGREEGYSLILEKSQDVVLYAPNVNDITDRVIKLYDELHRPSGKRR